MANSGRFAKLNGTESAVLASTDPSMPCLRGFHAIHFKNPLSILINPIKFLWMVFEILLKLISGHCGVLLMPLVFNGVTAFSYCDIPI